MNTKRVIAVISFIFFLSFSFGQHYTITATLDTTKLLIGDHLRVQLQISTPANAQYIFPTIDSAKLGNIELIGTSPIDTLSENNATRFHQTITVSVFDTGSYYFPSLALMGADSSILAQTDSLFFQVFTLAVDTTLAIKDIKLPVKAPLTFKEILPYLLVSLVGIAIIILLVWLFFKYGIKKKIKILQLPSKPKEKAHLIALRELEKLRKKKLWQEGKIKAYYSELTDIVRIYYKNRWNIDAMEMTSSEILDATEDLTLGDEILSKLQHLFTTADLVKFAKANPLPDDHDFCLKNAHFFITETAEKDNPSNDEPKKS